MGKVNKIVIALSLVVGILLFIFIGLAASYYASHYISSTNENNTQATDSLKQEKNDIDSTPKIEKNKEDGSIGTQISTEITTEIYMPTKFDTNANANYYIILRNDGNRHYEGSFKIESIKTQRETDKLGYLKLDPHEAKIISCVGEVPDKNSVNASFDGGFVGEEYQINKSLKYTIVNMEISNQKSKTGSSKLFIYVPPNTSDEVYLAICKEIKTNYDTGLIIADFSPIMINPSKNDTRITFAQNKAMRFSHVLFYTTDETNVNIQEMERRIVDI